MKKYEIWFGKDPEFLESSWPDVILNPGKWDDEEFDKIAVGKISTDDEYFFIESWATVIESPIAMWYWVFMDEKQIISGAIDPMDIETVIDVIHENNWDMELKIN